MTSPLSTGPPVEPAVAGFTAAARQVLAHVRAALDVEVAFVSRKVGDDYLVLTVDDDYYGLEEGLTVGWDDTLCARMVAGDGPRFAPDATLVPAYVTAAAGLGLELGAVVSVPMVGDDGELLGTLCAGSPRRRGDELLEGQPMVELMAGLLGSLLSAEVRLQREGRRSTSALPATVDELTGVADRGSWDRGLAAEDGRCASYGLPAAVLVVDVTCLSEVNRAKGHDSGDALLRATAQVLRESSRPEDLLARIKGDQLGMLLVECDTSSACTRAEQVRAALAQAGISASVGAGGRGRHDLSRAWQHADTDARARREELLVDLPDTAAWEVPTHPDAVLSELLDLARRQVGASISFLGAFTQGVRVMRAISSEFPLPIGPGSVEDLDVTYCQRILDGRLPSVIADTSLEPEAMALAVTNALPIGSYLGVPVVLSDGRLYGTLCALSPAADPSLSQRDADALAAIALSMAHVLEVEDASRVARRSVLRRVDAALAGTSTSMVFQPVLDMSGKVVGSEALARFQLEPVRGPDQWFHDASTVGQGVELELATARWALPALPQLPGWLSLNFSATTMVTPAFGALMAGVDVSRIVVEVSEHEEISDYDGLLRTLAPLRARGLRIAVDDAGAGFASLRHVVRLAPDVLKLDISLVRGIDTAPSQIALATALTTFAHEIGAVVVAEGVEHAAEMAALRAVGVGLVQGWHLGKGVPLEEFLRRWPVPVPRQRSVEETPVS